MRLEESHSVVESIWSPVIGQLKTGIWANIINGFINNPGNGTQYTLSSFTDYRIAREYGRSKCWRAQNALFFQRHLNRPGKYADKSHIKHNKAQVLHLEWNKILRKLL